MTKQNKSIHKIYDLSWKNLLKNRTAFRELIEDYVPEVRHITKSLNFDDAIIIPTSFISSNLKALESDILWEIPGTDNPDFMVYFLIEHQSIPDRLMALRILKYMAALYDSIVDKAEKNFNKIGVFQLNTAIPIVLYCGAVKWNVPLTFQELLAQNLPLKKPIIDVRYFLIDVNQIDEKKLLNLKNALSGLFLLEKARLSDRKEYLETALKCLCNEKDDNLLEAVLVTSYNILKERGKPSQADTIKTWHQQLIQEQSNMPQTMREFLTKIGREEGWEEGREKGRAEGLEKGHAEGRAEGLEKGHAEGRAEGLEKGHAEGQIKTQKDDLNQIIHVFQKALKKRGIPPDSYEQDFKKLKDIGNVGELIGDFMAASNPNDFLLQRFGH